MNVTKPGGAQWQPEEGETVLHEIKGDPAGDLEVQQRARMLVMVLSILLSGAALWASYRVWDFMRTAGWQILSHLDLYPITMLGSGLKSLLVAFGAIGVLLYIVVSARRIFALEILDRYVCTDRRVLAIGAAGGVQEEIPVSEMLAVMTAIPDAPRRICLTRREGSDDMNALCIDPMGPLEPEIDFLRRTYRIPVERVDASKKRGR